MSNRYGGCGAPKVRNGYQCPYCGLQYVNNNETNAQINPRAVKQEAISSHVEFSEASNTTTPRRERKFSFLLFFILLFTFPFMAVIYAVISNKKTN